MSAKSIYVLADLIFTLADIGLEMNAIRAEYEAMKSGGKTAEEAEAYLRKLAADELQKAKDAVK